MPERRPDPDQLLSSITETEAQAQRGRLRIFFGASPGVGKTYAMLQYARALRQAGVDVVAGYVETHGRSETSVLLNGLEQLPPRLVEHRGINVREFDLDAALSRHPALILVDELAHTNATGSRHMKRWQDVEELLAAGIDVFTTINVQHIESLNDVVAQITGVTVRETVPDSIIDRANEIELIDIPPDELLDRLRQGKVYVPAQAERALESFFSRANLTALREMALRQTAQKVDSEMQAHRVLTAPESPWAAAERLIVCIGPSPFSANLVRATHRIAHAMRAEWEAVYIETPASQDLPDKQKQRLLATMRLTEQLGGRSITLTGSTVADSLVEYARQRNATKIVVGKPSHSVWRDRIHGSLVDAVIRRSGDIDIYVLRTAGEAEARTNAPTRIRSEPRWVGFAVAFSAVAIFTFIALVARQHIPVFAPPNMIMLYLLVVVLVALRFGRRAAMFTSVLAVGAFDFFFISPYLTFEVEDVQYFLTFAVMLAVSLVIGNLTAQLRQVAAVAVTRERRTASLYTFSSQLAAATSLIEIAQLAERQVAELFQAQALVVVPSEDSTVLRFTPQQAALFNKPAGELAVAQWAFDNLKPAGQHSATLPGAEAYHLPLATSRASLGVLVVKPASGERGRHQLTDIDQLHQLETYSNLTALAIEREVQVQARFRVQAQVESERLRNSLLSSISHDLRTPLASISGSATTLLNMSPSRLAENVLPLLHTIREESDRLSLLVTNILDMTRLEAGAVQLHREWLPLEEGIGTALSSLESRSAGREIAVNLPDDLPLVKADPVLLERLFTNLIDNALKYTPADSPIEVSAKAVGGGVCVSIADRGPGLPEASEDAIFRKFGRESLAGVTSHPDSRGAGLGLSICKAIVEAHGGKITAANRPGGGAVFTFTLPQDEAPPQAPVEPDPPPQESAQ